MRRRPQQAASLGQVIAAVVIANAAFALVSAFAAERTTDPPPPAVAEVGASVVTRAELEAIIRQGMSAPRGSAASERLTETVEAIAEGDVTIVTRPPTTTSSPTTTTTTSTTTTTTLPEVVDHPNVDAPEVTP